MSELYYHRCPVCHTEFVYSKDELTDKELSGNYLECDKCHHRTSLTSDIIYTEYEKSNIKLAFIISTIAIFILIILYLFQ